MNYNVVTFLIALNLMVVSFVVSIIFFSMGFWMLGIIALLMSFQCWMLSRLSKSLYHEENRDIWEELKKK